MSTTPLAVIGNPISHSLSPAMHNAAIAELNLAFHYEAILAQADTLGDTLRQLRDSGYRGLNVTIPFKEAVMPHLDHIDPKATAIGAVNTIVISDGTLHGTNTDGDGFIMDLKAEHNVDPKGKSIAILGAGGAARGIIASLFGENPDSIAIINRSLTNANTIKTDFAPIATCPVHCAELNGKTAENLLANSPIIINTTPIGMTPNTDQSPLDTTHWICPDHVFYDTIYTPLETKLLQDAKANGATTINGVGMLAGQGALAFKLFTGHTAPFETMKRTILNNVN